jgi:hypothetical protein
MASASGSGSFYLSVTSAADHDFSVCDGATQVAGNLDSLFASDPTMDRRCLSSNDNVIEDHALVGVYSSSKPDDLAGARDYCASKNMPNE